LPSKITRFLTHHPVLIITLAVLLLIPSLIGYAHTRVNYDILSYLPETLDSTKGEAELENTFHDAATSIIVIDNMPAKDVVALKDKIKEVPGVNSALWVDDIADITIPKDMLPDLLRDTVYSGDSTLMLVTYNGAASSDETLTALTNVRKLLNKQCFLSGLSAVTKDTCDLVTTQVPYYVLFAFLFSIIAMTLCMRSWLLPLVFMLGFLFPVAYNFGSNVFLGEISYITQAIAAVLQLGVTMDFSIFLLNRYDEERQKYDDPRDAMAIAIQKAFVAIISSSTAVVAGFAALCFMELTLGRDIGIVMMKGVILGVLSTLTILPSLVLVFDKPIYRFTHRTLIPPFDRGTNFIMRHRKGFAIAFILIIIPAALIRNQTQLYYDLQKSLPSSLPSITASNKLKSTFNMTSTNFVIIDDNLPVSKVQAITSDIRDLDGIDSVVCYSDILGPAIPDDIVPSDVREIFKKDGRQIILVTTKYNTATDAANKQISEIASIAKKYDPTSKVTGESALTKDLIDVASHDFKVSDMISIAFIFLIVAFTFRSLALPVLLICIIECSIFINIGVAPIMGTVIPFISPTVVSCIQLGATVDYSILITSRFLEEMQNGRERGEAICIAMTTSFPAIVTSALVLFSATLGVSVVSNIEIIKSICTMLARGALVSVVVIVLFLPPLLYILQPVIEKLSFKRKKSGATAG
jgi:uncharacterized protein